jgi:hypothetical protein
MLRKQIAVEFGKDHLIRPLGTVDPTNLLSVPASEAVDVDAHTTQAPHRAERYLCVASHSVLHSSLWTRLRMAATL